MAKRKDRKKRKYEKIIVEIPKEEKDKVYNLIRYGAN